ncbi:membrane integrity-associated transporter subunit PqiC [Diaphorobacter aerolatus]|uniref:Membrane integrity-associated transporter subunit PqiC n=2 Tax=Diaphorobacter aerolatus TaxID=1288495 RepID=A0A7H0GQE5_9BURK|nr:membrane integrity-associated transporter subunit PqiC [Diaphorobacter aerolatus]
MRASLAAFVVAGLLAGCGSILPKPPQRADVYDFGPGVQRPADVTAAQQPLAPIALADFASTGLPDGRTAVFYRLAYANEQQLHPYTLARWSQTPAVLMQQAVRDRLSPRRAVIYGDTNIDQQIKGGKSPTVLRAEVEEFSQVFSSPQDSIGLVRVRASLIDSLKAGDELVAQRVFVAQRPAASPNAAGGAKALSEAAAQVAEDIARWVEQGGR